MSRGARRRARKERDQEGIATLRTVLRQQAEAERLERARQFRMAFDRQQALQCMQATTFGGWVHQACTAVCNGKLQSLKRHVRGDPARLSTQIIMAAHRNTHVKARCTPAMLSCSNYVFDLVAMQPATHPVHARHDKAKIAIEEMYASHKHGHRKKRSVSAQCTKHLQPEDDGEDDVLALVAQMCM